MSAEERLAEVLRAHGRSENWARITAITALPILHALAELSMGGDNPSFREIADAAGVTSTSTVGHHLRTLVALKLVERHGRHKKQARSVRITDAGLEVLNG